MTKPAAYAWADNKPACKHTHDILTKLLQLSSATGFAKAGQMPVRQLTYFPTVSPAPDVIWAHASQMAWRFCDRLLKVTPVKESPEVTLKQFIERFEQLFSHGDRTLTDIAQAADEFLVFPGERS